MRTKANTALKLNQKIQVPFFDADRFAQMLEKEGFLSSQSQTVIQALDDVVEERFVVKYSMDHLRLISIVVLIMYVTI